MATFRDFPGLQQFLVPTFRLRGREIGVGAHGAVVEVDVGGTLFAGKRIHDALVQLRGGGPSDISQRFVNECRLMSSLRHPNVVQFIGVCFVDGSRLPMLVMEYLSNDLDSLLEGNPGIPLSLKYSILNDVALGLAYLHGRNPPIIHRDLTARNVLLNSDMKAKIGDFGVARILDLYPGQLRKVMTQAPGNFTYMPPEALGTNPTYNEKIDIFSFGHLALYTVTQVFPDLLPPTRPDPNDPQRTVGLSEVERRAREMELVCEQMGGGHPLVRLIRSCLENTPQLRPSVLIVLQQLELLKTNVEDPYGFMNRLQMIHRISELETDLQSEQILHRATTQQLEASLQQCRRANHALENQLRASELRYSELQLEQAQSESASKDRTSNVSVETPKEKSTLRNKVTKYNKQIKEAVQSLIQQLRISSSQQRQREREVLESTFTPGTSTFETQDSQMAGNSARLQNHVVSPNLIELPLGSRRLVIKRGDISDEDVDIIVCSSLHGSTGVIAALNEKTDGKVQEDCRAYIAEFGAVGVGHIVVLETPPGRLRCKSIIHAVGPYCHEYLPETCKTLLAQVVTETLVAAERLEAKSIAIPAISTGGQGVEADLAAEAIIDTILAFDFKTSDVLSDIQIVIIDHPTYSDFARYLALKRSKLQTGNV